MPVSPAELILLARMIPNTASRGRSLHPSETAAGDYPEASNRVAHTTLAAVRRLSTAILTAVILHAARTLKARYPSTTSRQAGFFFAWGQVPTHTTTHGK